MTSEATTLLRPAPAIAVAPLARRRMAAADRRALLTRTVQLHVIPTLLRRPALCSTHVETLARLSMDGAAPEVLAFVAGLREAGRDAEAIYLDLLTPAARLLGQWWADDVCTFADVTIGVGHLQAALHAERAHFLHDAPLLVAPGRRALLMPLPGEQHGFGVSMLRDFFVRAGWDVSTAGMADGAALAAAVRNEWVDLVGFSISFVGAIDAARLHIAAVRAASRNPALIVMVGGLPFIDDPALALAIGADGTGRDGADAVTVAAALVPTRATPQ